MLRALVALLLFAAIAPAQIVNDPSAAPYNVSVLQRQADSGTLNLPVGTIYINKRINLPENIGGTIKSQGSGAGYWYPAGHPSHLSCTQSRICQLTPSEPVFVYRGTGWVSSDPVILEGVGAGSAIQIEGKVGPVATGQHRWANWGFYNWDTCFDALNGYYKADGTFIPDENHADNCTVRDIYVFNTNGIFRSRSQQALGWKFDGIYWQGRGADKTKPGVIFDIERGGWLIADHIKVENVDFELLRIRDFSPNNCYFRLTGIEVDRFLDGPKNFCWINYTGPANSKGWSRWSIEIEAFTAPQDKPIQNMTQFRNTDGLPQDDWKINIKHVPQGK